MGRLHTAALERVARGPRAWEDTPPLDPAKTAPFELPGTAGACLLIHGFTGSPWDMRPLGEALAAGGYHVRGLRLPGHGTTPRAMLEAGAPAWLGACDQALVSFSEPAVAVAGLSLGALLALVLAARHPERVAAVAALAPAVRFQDRVLRSLRVIRGAVPFLELLRPWVRKTRSDILDPQARAESPVLPAWPSERVRDLWAMQSLAWGAAARVTSPVMVMVAGQDQVVDAAGASALVCRLRRARSVRSVRVEDSGHILTRDRSRALVAAEVCAFFGQRL